MTDGLRMKDGQVARLFFIVLVALAAILRLSPDDRPRLPVLILLPIGAEPGAVGLRGRGMPSAVPMPETKSETGRPGLHPPLSSLLA